jgi:acyl carrier protein
MSDAAGIRNRIRDYIIQEFLPGESPDNLPDDLRLTDSGVLDSVSTLKLISFVEETYGVEVQPHEAASEFGSIAEIAALIEQKT